ncbi:hypothetical protein AB0M54_24445 [Actinoplanes sp. NPDC051470]|uniref:hypothetical protein n=1 Tax=Actinoplanes sp. NPDC051470 TaxID=3157224 RepID=UPI003439BC93
MTTVDPWAVAAAEQLFLNLLHTAEPSRAVKRRDTGNPVRALYFRADRSNRAQVEAWLCDAILYSRGDGYAFAGQLGEIWIGPGEYLVEEYGHFMAFRPDEFFAQFAAGEP